MRLLAEITYSIRARHFACQSGGPSTIRRSIWLNHHSTNNRGIHAVAPRRNSYADCTEMMPASCTCLTYSLKRRMDDLPPKTGFFFFFFLSAHVSRGTPTLVAFSLLCPLPPRRQKSERAKEAWLHWGQSPYLRSECASAHPACYSCYLPFFVLAIPIPFISATSARLGGLVQLASQPAGHLPSYVGQRVHLLTVTAESV